MTIPELIASWRGIAKAQMDMVEQIVAIGGDPSNHLEKRAAYAHCADELEKAAGCEWVKCSGRMPEPFVSVNIVVDFSDGEAPAAWTGFTDDTGAWRLPSSSVFDGEDGGIAGTVTHWQPLPQPPRQGGAG